MKARKYFFLSGIALAMAFVSCEVEDPDSCVSEDLSSDFSCPASVDAVATFCSDGVTNSYYTYGGSKYECTGIAENTCDGALSSIRNKLISKGCSGKKSGSIEAANVKLSAMAEKLLLEVKSKSLCN